MKVTVNECYELEGDYQNQFLGKEVFPQPKYKKLKASERSVYKVHYNDVYILEPLHYYYITFNENLNDFLNEISFLNIHTPYYTNGLLMSLKLEENRMFIFNASQNIVYIQKGSYIGEVVFHG